MSSTISSTFVVQLFFDVDGKIDMNVVVELRKGIWVDEKMKVDVFFPPGGVHNINNPRLIRANCLFPFPIVYVPIKIRVVKNTFTAVFTIIILQLSNKPVCLIVLMHLMNILISFL